MSTPPQSAILHHSLINNTATPKSGCYTLELETDAVAEANAKVIDFVAERCESNRLCRLSEAKETASLRVVIPYANSP